MAITYHKEDVSIPTIRRRIINGWIKKVASYHQKKTGDIAYIFCSDEKILEINNQYLQHDYYTDIITFDYTENDLISGDIFISIDTVRSNAEKYSVPYMHELYRVLIHGILHLSGIDDLSEEDERQMRKEEEKALRILFDEMDEIEKNNIQKKV